MEAPGKFYWALRENCKAGKPSDLSCCLEETKNRERKSQAWGSQTQNQAPTWCRGRL